MFQDNIISAYINMLLTEGSDGGGITKTHINEVFKKHKLAYIKKQESTGQLPKYHIVKRMDGSSVKGIITGGFGPMTTTDAHNKRHEEAVNNLHRDLIGIGLQKEDGKYYANKGSNKEISFKLLKMDFPEYAGRDSNQEYRQQAIVPHFY